MFKTYKGTWVTPNKFITEKGIELFITAYGMTIREVKPQLPFDCYILLWKITVKDWVKI